MRRMSARILRILALLWAVAITGQTPDTQSLELAKPIERQIAGGERHSYHIQLETDQYVFVTSTQDAIDIAISMNGPDGTRLVDVNRVSPPDIEDLGWITSQPGSYEIAIEAGKQASPGRYVLTLRALRSPTAGDRSRFAAFQKTWFEAAELVKKDTAASLRQALEKYQEALPLWRAAGDQLWEGYVQGELGTVYQRLGDLPHSRDALVQALDLYRAAGARLEESIALNSLGLAVYRLGDSPQSLKYLEEALALRRELGYRRGEAITLNNMGLAYTRLGKTTEALDLYLRSLDIRREVGDTSGEATTLDNLALTYRSTGQLQKALEATADALKLRRAIKDRRGEATSLNAMGLIHMAMGETEKAQEYWKLALPAFEEIGEAQGRAAVLGNLGASYSSSKNYKEGVAYLEKAASLRHETSNPQGEGVELNGLCTALLGLGEYSKALATGERAMKIFKDIDYKSGVAQSQYCLGQTLAHMGKRDEARAVLQQAITTHRSTGAIQNLSLSLAVLAIVERDSGNYAEALARSEEALSVAESERVTLTNPDQRATYRSFHTTQYALRVDVLMQMAAADPSGGFAARALEANERSRSLSLIEMVADSGTDLRQELTDDQRRREDSILTRISSLQREMLRGEVAAARKHELEQQLAAAERELELYQVELRAAGSRYATFHYARTLGVEDIKTELIGPDTALVEYALGEQRSYAWALTAHGLTTSTLPGRADIEKQVDAYRKEVSQRVSALTAGSALARIQLQSKAIYKALLTPFEKDLAQTRSLIIVPDGGLDYLPFETLMNGSSSALIERFAISYSPSASALAVLKTRKDSRDIQKMLLAFADPDASPAGPSAALSASVERGLDLTRLPNARAEVAAISSLYKPEQTRSYLGSDATEHAIKTEDLRNYRFLHFATHGYFDEERPARSGIVLSPGSDSAEDGLLQVGEIMRLRLNADLVTLSACQTGLGQLLAGEGVMGLTRAFLYAGAQSVVVSLWNVNDSATAELMKTFYRELSRGTPREEALRRAKLSLIRGSQAAWRHPYYWAPFIFVGQRGKGI